MTWTKLGDEWPDHARDLSDAAHRTHVDALCWSNRRSLDLLVPRRDLRRFAETIDPDAAVLELVELGWWEDRGDAWWIGLHFADWQLESTVVQSRRDKGALRMRRHRLHLAGDHTMCLTENCTELKEQGTPPSSRDAQRGASRDASPGTGRVGSGREALPAVAKIKNRAGEGGVGGEPTYPEQCAKHAHNPHPPKCGDCGRARRAHYARVDAEAEARRPRMPPKCTGCDEKRMVETPTGMARCPSCGTPRQAAS